MKRRLVTVGLSTLLVLFAALLASNIGWIKTATGQDNRPTDVPIGTEVRLTTYALLPGESRSDIAAWADKGVIFVDDAQALYAAVADGPGSVVYVNAAGLSSLDAGWVQDKYRTGVAFGGVGIPLSELGEIVGSQPTVPDLAIPSDERMVQMSFSFDYEGNGITSHYYYTDYWLDLTAAPLLLERAVVTSIES